MDNPFAPPTGTIGDYYDPANAGTGYRIFAKAIISDSSLRLPEMCVTCGIDAPHGTRLHKKLYYFSEMIFLLFVFNIIFVLIAYVITRKRTDVAYTLCPECNARRTSRRILFGFTFTAFSILLFLAISMRSATFGLSALAAVLPVIVMYRRARGPVRVIQHRQGSFTYCGFSDRFLDRLGPSG